MQYRNTILVDSSQVTFIYIALYTIQMSSYVKLSWQRHWQVMMLWFMSSFHKKESHICIKNVIIERMPVVTNMHKTSYS